MPDDRRAPRPRPCTQQMHLETVGVNDDWIGLTEQRAQATHIPRRRPRATRAAHEKRGPRPPPRSDTPVTESREGPRKRQNLHRNTEGPYTSNERSIGGHDEIER